MIIELILAAITALLGRSLLKSAPRYRQALLQTEHRMRLAGLLFSCLLLVIGILGWAFTVFIILNGIVQTLSPSSPAPFILLPWFIGMCVTVFPWQFAEMILNILHKDDKPFY